MELRPAMRVLALVFCLWAGVGAAAEVTVRLSPALDLDEAGFQTRRALAAWEAAAAHPLPQSWELTPIRVGQPVRYGRATFLMLLETGDGGRTLVLQVVDDSGPDRAKLGAGAEAVLGPLRVLVASPPGADGWAQVMVRADRPAPLLVDPAPESISPTDILGYESPDRLTFVGPDGRATAFAAHFVQGLNAGLAPAEAAARAREAVPPNRGPVSGPGGSLAAGGGQFPGQAAAAGPYALSSQPTSARVTFRLVRGESSILRELSGSAAYDSSGRTPSRPRVSAGGGPSGGSVAVGSPGDRFRARLRALEASGRVNVDSESFVRVALGGDAFFNFHGPTGGVDGYVGAVPRGPGRVELYVDQRQGDWSFLGGVSTRVIVRDGETVPLARNTSSRTTSYRSGAPILSDIPFAGPLFGSESSSRTDTSYALFVTVELEE